MDPIPPDRFWPDQPSTPVRYDQIFTSASSDFKQPSSMYYPQFLDQRLYSDTTFISDTQPLGTSSPGPSHHAAEDEPDSLHQWAAFNSSPILEPNPPSSQPSSTNGAPLVDTLLPWLNGLLEKAVFSDDHQQRDMAIQSLRTAIAVFEFDRSQLFSAYPTPLLVNAIAVNELLESNFTSPYTYTTGVTEASTTPLVDDHLPVFGQKSNPLNPTLDNTWLPSQYESDSIINGGPLDPCGVPQTAAGSSFELNSGTDGWHVLVNGSISVNGVEMTGLNSYSSLTPPSYVNTHPSSHLLPTPHSIHLSVAYSAHECVATGSTALSPVSTKSSSSGSFDTLVDEANSSPSTFVLGLPSSYPVTHPIIESALVKPRQAKKTKSNRSVKSSGTQPVPLPRRRPRAAGTKSTSKAHSQSQSLPKGVENLKILSGQSHPVDNKSNGTKIGQRSSVSHVNGASPFNGVVSMESTPKPLAKQTPRGQFRGFSNHESSFGGYSRTQGVPLRRSKKIPMPEEFEM